METAQGRKGVSGIIPLRRDDNGIEVGYFEIKFCIFGLMWKFVDAEENYFCMKKIYLKKNLLIFFMNFEFFLF